MGRYGGRRTQGPWPGRGPFSHLPPWERPGWLLGRPRGFCGYYFLWLLGNQPQYSLPYTPPEQELQMLERYKKELEKQLEEIKEKLRKYKEEK